MVNELDPQQPDDRGRLIHEKNRRAVARTTRQYLASEARSASGRGKVLPVAGIDAVRATSPGNDATSEEEGVLGAAGRGFVKGALTGVRTELAARAVREPDSQADGGPTARGQTSAKGTAEGARGVVMHPDHLAALEAHESRQPAKAPAPETRQPPSLDVIDVIQGNPTPDVMMHPSHIAGLKALQANGDDGLQSGGAGYGR